MINVFDEKWLEEHQRKMAGIQKKSVPAAPAGATRQNRAYRIKIHLMKSVHGLDVEEI
jgi:hypothetical protein